MGCHTCCYQVCAPDHANVGTADLDYSSGPCHRNVFTQKMHLTMFAKWRIFCLGLHVLAHWAQETPICASKLTTIVSDHGFSPGRCQAIIWTNAGILLTGLLGINLSEILIGVYIFSVTKMHLKISGKRRQFSLGLNALTDFPLDKMAPVLADAIFKCISWMKMITVRLKCHCKIVPRGPITNKSALVR